MRRILTLFFLLLCASARGQRLDPADYIFPVRGVEGLYSANFGELRPGHFHAGVDIKTDGVEGKLLVAVADGYVSRITVTPGGYGRALYLTLGNGTTAVYGHLQRFRDDLEYHVREERYRRSANSVDLHFGPGQWPVRQGDPVGYSGNSGGSLGPHLHFELRDTPSQRRLNLVRQRVIRPHDDLPPRIMRIHYVEVDTVPGDRICLRSAPRSQAVVRTTDGRYRLTHDEPVETGRKGYFIAEVTDRRNGVHNTFGIWRLTLLIDGEPRFEYRQDGFPYELARMSDAVSCYPLQLGSRNEVIRLAQLEAAPESFYPLLRERGLVRTAPGQTRRIRIEAEDDSGNRSQLEFDIRGREGEFRATADTASVVVRPDCAATVGLGFGFTARIPSGALYESAYCRPVHVEVPKTDSGVVVLSPAFRLFSYDTPLAHPVEVSLRAEVPHRLQLHTLLAARDRKGRAVCIGGSYAAGRVTARTRSTDGLTVVADTLPPQIRPLFKPGADLSGAASLRFRVSDNFAGVARWTLRIDQRWVPCDRFPMQGTLVHTFDTPPERRSHRLSLSVTDGAGNTASWEGTFYR